jgi:predicted phosphodiesterase
MRYAIISDVHGNLHGLEAVLEDAAQNKADRYLLLGDYFLDFPYTNEVIETIRAIPEATAIKGNKDEYLLRLSDEVLLKKQMAAARWNLSQLSEVNREYIGSLPETAVITVQGTAIRLMHSSDIFFRHPRIQPFYSSWFREKMTKEPFSHEEYLELALKALLARQDALAAIEALPRGIFLFGHNHLQFHAEYKGRYFINPGSCGVPLDGDITAAYTLLDVDAGDVGILERRVPYDKIKVISDTRASCFATEAPEWCSIVTKELLDGMDYFEPFMQHVLGTARRLGDLAFPVSDDTWQTASETWDFDRIAKKD